jgi:hypothetical protein
MHNSIRATVRRAKGRTINAIGTILDGEPTPVARIPTPEWVEISAEEGGFYLFHFDHEGKCIADTWHPSLDNAKAQAMFELNIQENEWTVV